MVPRSGWLFLQSQPRLAALAAVCLSPTSRVLVHGEGVGSWYSAGFVLLQVHTMPSRFKSPRLEAFQELALRKLSQSPSGAPLQDWSFTTLYHKFACPSVTSYTRLGAFESRLCFLPVFSLMEPSIQLAFGTF